VIAKTLAKFTGRSISKILLDEEHAAQQKATERTESCKRLAMARERQAKETPALAKRIAEKEEAIRAANEAHAKAELQAAAELQGLRGQAWSLDYAVQREEGILRTTAPDCIDTFLAEMRELRDETRRAIRSESEREWTQNKDGFRRNAKHLSNKKAIEARLAAIGVACQQAEALKLVDLDEAEIEARLAKLRQAIPSASTLNELLPV
jgi:hypothetical protein